MVRAGSSSISSGGGAGGGAGSRGQPERPKQEPLLEETRVGQLLQRRRKYVSQRETLRLHLPHAVPLQSSMHQQHHITHVWVQGG